MYHYFMLIVTVPFLLMLLMLTNLVVHEFYGPRGRRTNLLHGSKLVFYSVTLVFLARTL
jgi:hypothetical protein